MPLARIITRAVEQSQELAAELRGRGYDVEIVSPFDSPSTRADLELHLEECTPEEALIRAGVLPETNDMSVFIAPGAIANRRQVEHSTPPTQMPKKWYEPGEEAGIELPFMVKPLDGDGDHRVRSAEMHEFEDDTAARASEELASDSSGFASEESADSESTVRPISAKSAFHKTLSESSMDELASARTPATARVSSGTRAPLPVRTLPMPASSPRFFGWKAAAGIAVLAVVVLVMGAVRRKPGAPPATNLQQTAPASVLQTTPANDVQRSAPADAKKSLPSSHAQGLTTNAVGRERKMVKTLSESTRPAGTQPEQRTRTTSEAKLKRAQPNDGIKRYSDLD